MNMNNSMVIVGVGRGWVEMEEGIGGIMTMEKIKILGREGAKRRFTLPPPQTSKGKNNQFNFIFRIAREITKNERQTHL